MSFLRATVFRPATRLRSVARPCLTASPIVLPAVYTTSRSYASRKKDKDGESSKGSKGVVRNTDDLIPGSQRIVQSPEYRKAEEKMKVSLDHFRKEIAALEVRASGRVTAAVLSPVRVVLPDGDPKGSKLEEIATVGVRDGNMLLVTVFEEHVS